MFYNSSTAVAAVPRCHDPRSPSTSLAPSNLNTNPSDASLLAPLTFRSPPLASVRLWEAPASATSSPTVHEHDVRGLVSPSFGNFDDDLLHSLTLSSPAPANTSIQEPTPRRRLSPPSMSHNSFLADPQPISKPSPRIRSTAGGPSSCHVITHGPRTHRSWTCMLGTTRTIHGSDYHSPLSCISSDPTAPRSLAHQPMP
ncbi:hypothetical protein C0995_008726 [Termitomyces sp. Mi166|nr:hypothetical protein C0995_008726 [Termitomyces sp. Mi166\